MDPKKDKELCKKYPNLYRDRFGSIYETCMCWGFTCGDGWYDIIDKLSAKLEAEIIRLKKEGIPEEEIPVAAQVKEKFGTLTMYVDSATEEMSNWIKETANKSASICEYCGNPGSLRTDRYWKRTLCDSCNEEEK